MPTRNDTNKSPVYEGERVRQGYIALRKPWQRRLFFGALLAMAFLVLGRALFFGW